LAIERGDNTYPKILLNKELKKLSTPNFASKEYEHTPYAVLADLDLPDQLQRSFDTAAAADYT